MHHFEKCKTLILSCALLCVAAVTALGSPLVWSFQDVSFVQGGTITGSFTYDADTQIVSSWDISVVGLPDPALDVTYTPLNSAIFDSVIVSSLYFRIVTPFSGPLPVGSLLDVAFDSALTDAGGTVTLGRDEAPNPHGLFTDTAVYPSQDDAFVFGGILSAGPAPVPEPTTFGMLFCGCSALWVVRRMTRRRQPPGESYVR